MTDKEKYKAIALMVLALPQKTDRNTIRIKTLELLKQIRDTGK